MFSFENTLIRNTKLFTFLSSLLILSYAVAQVDLVSVYKQEFLIVQFITILFLSSVVFRGRLARIDYEFLMNNRKHEERTIGNFLMSVCCPYFEFVSLIHVVHQYTFRINLVIKLF